MEKKENRVWKIASIVIIVLLSLMLVLNLAIIIQGFVSPDNPPSVFGLTPLVVLSGSMDGDLDDSFEAGSLVFVKTANTDDLDKDDVIAFKDPASKSVPKAITTHRIVDVKILDDGSRAFVTKGDANNAKDAYHVNESDVVGVYSFHLNGLGSFMMFLETPFGMLLFVGLPLAAVILVDVFVVRRKATKKKDEETAAMEEELARLRRLAEAIETKEPEAKEEPIAESVCSEAEVAESAAPENKEA